MRCVAYLFVPLFYYLKQLIDFHEMLYESCEIGGHHNLVFSNFLKLLSHILTRGRSNMSVGRTAVLLNVGT